MMLEEHRAVLPLVVLPWGERSAVFAVEDAKCVLLAEVDCPATSRPTLEDGVLIGIVEKNGAPVACVFDLKGHALEPRAGSPYPLPEGFEPSAVARSRNALYVGGSSERFDSGGEIAFVRDLDVPSSAWRPLEVPVEVRRNAKSIDGLHVDARGRLIAIDDIVLPKYLFLYDISDPLAPHLTSRLALPTHYTYEGVRASSLGRSWLAVLSSGDGRGGKADFLAFHDADDLLERCCVVRTNRFPGFLGVFRRRPPSRWLDAVVVRERAVLAAAEDGIGVLDLSLAAAHRAWSQPPGPGVVSLAPRLRGEEIRYLRQALEHGELVLRVARVPGRDDVVAAAIGRLSTVETADKHREVWNVSRVEVIALGK